MGNPAVFEFFIASVATFQSFFYGFVGLLFIWLVFLAFLDVDVVIQDFLLDFHINFVDTVIHVKVDKGSVVGVCVRTMLTVHRGWWEE